MEILRQGSRHLQVKLLQRLLNKKGASPALSEDAAFGPRSHAAVVAFQKSQGLAPDGVVGPQTWNRLGLRTDATHNIRLYAQPTNMTCWSAAATMMLGSNMSVGPGAAKLGATGGLKPSAQNVAVFASAMGWQMHYPQSWPVAGLAGLLRRGPVWAVGGGAQNGGWLHAIMLSAMWSDDAPDGTGTMLRIHDPWPPNVGEVYASFYNGSISGFDFVSLYMLHP